MKEPETSDAACSGQKRRAIHHSVNWSSAVFLFILSLCSLMPLKTMAGLPKGSWSMTGEIADVILSSRGPSLTNTYSITGHCDDGNFLLDLTPAKSSADVAESAGWDGELLCLIQRWSNPQKWSNGPQTSLLRTNSLAYVEPSVFSRYASFALQPILVAFADSNLLSNLEKGQIPAILGNMRVYPEENNIYAVRRLSSGYTEIEAFSPGLKLGTTNLVPIPGFERGFTRWTHRSIFTASNTTNVTLSVEYNRFSPINGKLVQNRTVTAQISFCTTNQEKSSFRPIITENSIVVQDCSSRYEILPWTKGAVEWICQYEFTNKNWDFDTNSINAQLAQFKTNMILMGGYPKDLLAKANTIYEYRASPTLQSHRIITLSVLIGFSVLSAIALWFSSRRG